MSRGNATRKTQLRKIVYFDEGSATDYIQIVSGGERSVTTESTTDGDAKVGAKASGNLGIGSEGAATSPARGGIVQKLVEALTGVTYDAAVGGEAEVTFDMSRVAKSIVSNTVLTDFLMAVGRWHDVRVFDGYSVTSIENSLASYALMTPYLAMIRDGGIPAGDFTLALDKLDATITNAKGYFEFLGTSGSEKVIFRFNNTSFKNNYRARDLTRMNLAIYAIEVGSCTIGDLDLNKEMNVAEAAKPKNPDYELAASGDWEGAVAEEELKVFDVLLAGVRVDG